MQKTYTIYDQKGENQYPIYDKTAEKSHIREYTQGDELPVDFDVFVWIECYNCISSHLYVLRWRWDPN